MPQNHPSHLACKRRKVAFTQTTASFTAMKDKKRVTSFLVKNLAIWMYDQKLSGNFKNDLDTVGVATLVAAATGLNEKMVRQCLNHDLKSESEVVEQAVPRTNLSLKTNKDGKNGGSGWLKVRATKLIVKSEDADET